MSNKGEGYAFRDSVLLCMHDHGLTAASRPRERHGLPPDERHPRGDILGLPITLAVKSSSEVKLSGALTEAKSEAKAEGRELYAAIHRRRGFGVAEAFVTLDLTTFLTVLSRLHPEVVTTT